MSRSGTSRHTQCLRAALALASLVALPSHATNYSVGTGGGCTHTTLQAAINAAQASPAGADVIRVSAETFTAQELTINTAQELDIVGGYPACNITTPGVGFRATLDGNGGNARTVMRITVPTGGTVRLRNLNVRRGDASDTAEGGGIYFEGNGVLEVRDSNITNNHAGYGAGIYARGTGAASRVVFGANVTVVGNTARHSGGGVYVDQTQFDMTQQGSGIYLNEALGEGGGGYGGGMILLAKGRSAYAYLGAGMGSLGVVFNNKAKYGGGVAMTGEDGNDTESRLEVFSPIAGQPAGIRDNVASIQGGALYLLARGPLFGSSVYTNALLWNTVLDGNEAPDGAAIFSDCDGEHTASSVYLNSDRINVDAPAGFVCPSGQFCGGIVDNVARNTDGSVGDGAVIHTLHGFSLEVGHHDDDRPARGGLVIEGNRGGRLIFSGDESFVRLDNLLVADNEVAHALIHTGNAGFLRMHDLTITGNGIPAGNPVIQYGDAIFQLRRSIIWQPGRTVLQCSGCAKTFERVMANERDSLDGGNGTQVVVASPRFVDPERGDYQLRAASPAVDYAAASGGGGDRDAFGRARNLNLPVVTGAFNGVRDIGAFERPALQPLVLNSDLDSDLRLWEPILATAVSRDTLNASGGGSSGSLRVNDTAATPGGASIAAKQCVHLPGPTRYELNGWGRAGTTGGFPPPVLDTAQLRWELRHDGNESCTGGTIAASGTLTLSSGDWRRAAAPAVIDVLPQDWTSRTSLSIYLVVVEAGTTAPVVAQGWFDGITLDVAGSAADTLFQNGYE